MRIVNINNLGFFKRLKLAGRVVAASGIGYDAGTPSRTNRSFGLSPGLFASADRHLNVMQLGNMREKCRMYDRQVPIFSGFLDRASENIFGNVFDFLPIITGGEKTADADLAKKVKEYIWRRMEADICDAEGNRDFTEMAATSLRAVWNDGDILLTKRSDGSLLPFEADQVDNSGADSGGKRIVMGVELNDVNRAVAYWVKQRKTTGTGGISTGNFTTAARVLARDAFFPAYRKRFSQTRGVPFLAVILSFFDRTNNYIDYESLAAEGNSMLGYQLTAEVGAEPFNPPVGVKVPGEKDNEDTSTSDTFEKLQKMEQFQIFDLSGVPGQKVGMIKADRPGSNYEPYITTNFRIIGAGVGFPLELFLMDFSRTNFSSGKLAIGCAKKMFKAWQNFMFNKFCGPWYKWQIARGIATGELPADPRIFNVTCRWPVWEYIDKFKESMGNRVAMELTNQTASGCIRDQGGEPDEVFDEKEQEIRNAIGRSTAIKKDTGVDVPYQVFCGMDTTNTTINMNIGDETAPDENKNKKGNNND